MKDIYEILTEIKNTSGSNDKIALLTQYKGDPLLEKVLKFLFDDLIVTGISKRKLSKTFTRKTDEPLVTLESLEEMMEYLETNNSGKDFDIKMVQNFIEFAETVYGQEVADMVAGIAMKDYPIGVSKVTLNKVFGKDFIFKFDVRKGSKFEGKLKLGVEYAQTIKYDGVRVIFTVDETGVKAYGRSGKQITGLTLLEAAMWEQYKATGQAVMYDGELLAINHDNLKSDELFKVTSGMLRRDGDKEDVQFIMFDTMPLEEFRAGKSKLVWEDRREKVVLISSDINQFAIKISGRGEEFVTCPQVLYRGIDLVQINHVQGATEAQGYEGTMLDEVTAYYEAKRTKSLLKYKTFHTVDLRVLRVEEHTRGGKLGSIVVDYKGNELGVGSGFSEAQRKEYWENKDVIVGKIVEVGYFEESSNDKGQPSLRFPTFKGIRFDKDEVSYN